LAKRDDISSTEKLLDAIRNKTNETEEETIEFAPSDMAPEIEIVGEPFKSEKKPSIEVAKPQVQLPKPHETSQGIIEPKNPLKSLTSVKTMVVGVSIRHFDVTMVMINRISGQNRELVKYKKIPFSPGINRDSKQFPEFLKSALKSFCGSYGNVELWVSIPDETLDNRYLTIPRVSEKKISNAIYWTFRKEVPFDESEMIFDYEIIGETTEDNVKKLVVSAYVVSKQAVNGIKTLFSDIKFPVFGISVMPFAIQNFFRTKAIEAGNKKICTINIGLEHSRIDIFSDCNLIMSRNVKTGIDSMIGAIREESEGAIAFEGMEDEPEATESIPVVEIETFDTPKTVTDSNSTEYVTSASPGLEELLKSDYDTARKIFFEIINQSKFVTLTDEEQRVSETIFHLISPVAERLLRQVERTFEYYSRTYRTSGPEILIFSGPTSTYKRLTEHIGNQLGLESGIIDPFSSSNQLGQTVPPPRSLSERENFTHAYGLALSDMSHTPNLLYTYRQKEVDRQVKKVNYGVISTFAILLIVCIMTLLGMTQKMNSKESEINEIRTSLDRFVPNVDQKLLQDMYIQVQKKKAIMKRYALNCIGTAVISEISTKTPDSIKLTGFEAELFSPSESETSTTSKQQESKNKSRKDTIKQEKIKTLTITGYVKDESMSLESTLAGYLVDLNRSPMFGKVTIQKKALIMIEEEEVLNFTAIVEMS